MDREKKLAGQGDPSGLIGSGGVQTLSDQVGSGRDVLKSHWSGWVGLGRVGSEGPWNLTGRVGPDPTRPAGFDPTRENPWYSLNTDKHYSTGSGHQ